MERILEKSYELSENAVDRIKKLLLLASPKNYEFWYAYAEGRYPELCREIDFYLGDDSGFNQEDIDDLYHRHIAKTDLSANVLELVARLEEEVTSLGDMLDESGDNADQNTSRLGEISDELNQSANSDPESISKLIDGVVTIVKSMHEENTKLKGRLQESSAEVSSLRVNLDHIQKEAMIDALTQINNRRAFDAYLAKEFNNFTETEQPLSLILLDIDHFKKFNDTWGHQTGDQVLRLVAEVIKSNVKGRDVLARYGGEEFAVILPNTSIENAHMLADRIRQTVEARRLKKKSTGESLGVVTISIGVTQAVSSDDIETIIERSDGYLYEAKRAGRNRVVSDRNTTEKLDSQQTG